MRAAVLVLKRSYVLLPAEGKLAAALSEVGYDPIGRYDPTRIGRYPPTRIGRCPPARIACYTPTSPLDWRRAVLSDAVITCQQVAAERETDAAAMKGRISSHVTAAEQRLRRQVTSPLISYRLRSRPLYLLWSRPPYLIPNGHVPSCLSRLVRPGIVLRVVYEMSGTEIRCDGTR